MNVSVFSCRTNVSQLDQPKDISYPYSCSQQANRGIVLDDDAQILPVDMYMEQEQQNLGTLSPAGNVNDVK